MGICAEDMGICAKHVTQEQWEHYGPEGTDLNKCPNFVVYWKGKAIPTQAWRGP